MTRALPNRPVLAGSHPPGIRHGGIVIASTLSFRAVVVFILAGMVWGIAMAASGNHQTLAAHAHLNLQGWVSLFLFGRFYHVHANLDATRLATLQVTAWIVSAVLIAVGVGLIPVAHPLGEPLAMIGSLIALADALLFAVLVFRRRPAMTRHAGAIAAR